MADCSKKKWTVDTRPDSSTSRLGLSSSGGAILVAVNGRSSGWQALDWASAECAACRSSLRIVHVVNGATPILDPMAGVVLDWRAGDWQGGVRILEEAARRARRIAPDIPISTHLDSGNIARSISDAGRYDALIVIGRGCSKRRGVLSTVWRVARISSTPVAVVELNQARTNGPSAGRVVVGINGNGGPVSAVAYAFQAASRRGTGLTAIHAWEPGSMLPWRSEVGGRGVDLRRIACIEGPLQQCMLDYPDIDLRGRLVEGSAGEALVGESRSAALLVVGARPQGRIHHALFSSVPRIAFRWAESPVAIIKSSACNTAGIRANTNAQGIRE